MRLTKAQRVQLHWLLNELESFKLASGSDRDAGEFPEVSWECLDVASELAAALREPLPAWKRRQLAAHPDKPAT
jgi:hypothetical protein